MSAPPEVIGVPLWRWECPKCRQVVETKTPDSPGRCPRGCASRTENYGVTLRSWDPPSPPPPDPPHVIAFAHLPLAVQFWLRETAAELVTEAHNASVGKGRFDGLIEAVLEFGRLAYEKGETDERDHQHGQIGSL